MGVVIDVFVFLKESDVCLKIEVSPLDLKDYIPSARVENVASELNLGIVGFGSGRSCWIKKCPGNL